MKTTVSFTFIMFLYHLTSFGQNGSISGQVQDDVTNEFISDAVVILKNHNVQTLTNTTGQYTFEALQTGKDTLIITYTGYATYSMPVSISAEDEKNLTHRIRPGSFQLDAIQITAEPEAQTRIISGVDINLRSINTSQDVLRMVPGLFTAQHAGGGKAEQIFLRGFDIDHGTDIAISTDGMPVNMVSHAHGQGYADLHYLIPETVDRVHFGKGPYHTHQGNLATAGYVGFQTRNVLDENVLSFQAGQFNSYRALGMVNLLNKNEAKASQHAYVAGEYYTTDGYFNSPQNFNRTSLFGKYNGSLGNGHYLTASASSFKSRWDASGQIPLRAIEDGSIGFFGAIDDTEGGQTSRSNVNLQLSSTLNAHSWIKNQLFYSHYDFELYSNFTFFLEDSINGDQIKQKESRNLIGYKGSYERQDQWLDKSWRTELGVQYRQDFSEDNELSHTVNKTTLLERLAYGDVSEGNIGVYANETIELTDRLTINAGLRFDHFRFSYKDQIEGTDYETVSDNIVSPKLNAYYKLSDKVQVFGNAGYGFHSNDTRVVVVQNARQTLPRALGFDAGAIWKPASRLILTGTIWHLDLDQEFVYVGDAAIVEPSGQTRRMGIEFSGRWQILNWLYADMDFNYTIANAVEEPEGMDYIPLAPRISSIGGFTVMTDKHWSGSIRYRYLGDRPANEDNSVIAKGYTVLDAVVTYRTGRFEFGVNIDNVFDVRWREAQFDTTSRLKDEPAPVSEIHFTAGTPFNLRAHVAYHF
jgi:outer membrane cobalamin receptor